MDTRAAAAIISPTKQKRADKLDIIVLNCIGVAGRTHTHVHPHVHSCACN